MKCTATCKATLLLVISCLSIITVKGQYHILRKQMPTDTVTAATTPKSATKAAVVKSSEIIIRNSFESTDEKADPASVSLTMPSGKPGSYLVDAGIQWNFTKQELTGEHLKGNSFGPFVVLKRNTMTEKEQKLLKGGFQYQWASGTSSDKYNHINYTSVSVEYLHDWVGKTHSFVSTGYWSYLSNNISDPKKIFINNYHAIGSSSLFYLLAFNAGLETQRIWENDSDKTGFQGRLYGNTSFSIALRKPGNGQKTRNKYAWPKLLEISTDYTARYAVINSGTAFDKWQPLFKPSLTYFPLSNSKFSVALSYSNGSDPIAGLASQKFWMLAIQFEK
jgi:hypothetical protein